MTNVKVFFDFNCPFCFIATGIVEQLKKDRVDFFVEWIPYEQYPEIPFEGRNLYDIFSKDKTIKMFKTLGKYGSPYNISFNENVNIKFNSHKALLAGEYAKSVHKYNVFSREVFKTAFVDIKNIGEENIINDIGKKVGLDVEEMNRNIYSGKYDEKLKIAYELVDKYDIEEVPTFLINNEKKVINIRKYKRIKDAILEAE